MTKRVILLFIGAMILSACGTPTLPCGGFTFNGTSHSNRGIDMDVSFDFDPATCGATCTCDTVAYVQIVRIVDFETGNFLSPNSDQTDRIVTGRTSATPHALGGASCCRSSSLSHSSSWPTS